MKKYTLLIATTSVILIVILGGLIGNSLLSKKITYNTQDKKFSIALPKNYKVKLNENSYDIYAHENTWKYIGLHVYDLNELTMTSEEILDSRSKYLEASRNNVSLLQNKETITMNDKTITRIVYRGNQENSETCVYVLATIDFKDLENTTIFLIEDIAEEDYGDNSQEFLDILKSVRLNKS